MVNYVLSFCKITGASKIFSRHFYLPLLKPLTPKEALRTLRITGKWLLGAKVQHYIPVLLNHKKKRSKRCKNYGTKVHEEMADYTYMSPVIDPDNENHKRLLEIIKNNDNKGVFVYTVEDKKYNIVLQAHFEFAIRNGEIIDVLVSQKNDKIIVKLKDFKKIPMEIEYFDGSNEMLYCGEGATSVEEEKFHHHGKYTMGLARIFEEKELIEEKWEEELRKLMKRRRKQKGEGTKAWKEMVKESIKNLDWKKFEEDAKKVIDEIDEPASEQLIPMEIDDLTTTKNVNDAILNHKPELLNQLPTMKEIPDIIKNMGNGMLTEIEINGKQVSGVKVKLASGKECFISGQMVHTEDGDVFVPGQTIENEFGDEYTPGITINIDNKPTLISGLIMGEEERNPMFLPTQSTITSDGQLTFATVPEERPPPQPENQRYLRKKLEPENIIEEDIELEPIEIDIIIESESESESQSSQSEDDSKSTVTSIELNNSEMEELDAEAIRLKKEQQRLEIEKLKQILLDDGMDEILANLEDKKAKLKEKLEELRKLCMNAENNLITYVNDSDAVEVASKISNDNMTINRISDILLTMTRRLSTFRDKNNIRPDNIQNNNILTEENLSDIDVKFSKCTTKLKILFKTAIVAANDVFKNRPKDQLLALNAIGEILTDALKNDEFLLEELLNLMNTPVDRNEICMNVFKQLTQNIVDTKTSTLANIRNKTLSPSEIFDNISKILDKNNLYNEPFIKIAKVDPQIVKILIENIDNNINKVKSEKDAMEILEKCIIDATITLTNINFENISNASPAIIKDFIEDAIIFAKALNLDEIVDELSDTLNVNSNKQSTINLLKRITLIQQLAERDYSLKTAISRLKKNPDRGKNDPRIRQLIRESGILTSKLPKMKNAREIPLQLMKKQNLLAIEDFLIQRSVVDLPVMINRGSWEVIVPKEATNGVLSGRMPYTLLDEDGFTNINIKPRKRGTIGPSNWVTTIDNFNNSIGVRDRSSERNENQTYPQARKNVRKLKKLFNNRRQSA